MGLSFPHVSDSVEEAQHPLWGRGGSLSEDNSWLYPVTPPSSCPWTWLNTVILHEILLGKRTHLALTWHELAWAQGVSLVA